MHIRAPISIYEVHLPTWMRVPEEGNRPLTYRELAPRLTDYVSHMGFTHVEFLPVMENLEQPGKECDITAFFAASSRQGSPQDLMFLIDYLHQHGIGVILDWVASHFPAVDFGLTYFDGTWLFEHGTWQLTSDGSKQGYPFDYSRGEVRSFLLSNAAFWFDKYHADAIRLTSVTTMLHLDEDRKPDNWIPNAQGGRENLDGIDFLRKLNSELYRLYPDVQIIAEESSDWPMVSRPTYSGGLGFGFKWDKSFSEQLVPYLGSDPFFRKLQHEKLTSRIDHALNENSVLSLSHAQVRDGRGSLLAQMSGDDWQRLANLRLLLGCQFLEPGKKLLFMGSEFAQWQEWNPNTSLDWHLLGYNRHRTSTLGRDLNLVYRREPALHQTDSLPEDFEWVISDDREHSVLVGFAGTPRTARFARSHKFHSRCSAELPRWRASTRSVGKKF